jgi:hypothetical protein
MKEEKKKKEQKSPVLGMLHHTDTGQCHYPPCGVNQVTVAARPTQHQATCCGGRIVE